MGMRLADKLRDEIREAQAKLDSARERNTAIPTQPTPSGNQPLGSNDNEQAKESFMSYHVNQTTQLFDDLTLTEAEELSITVKEAVLCGSSLYENQAFRSWCASLG